MYVTKIIKEKEAMNLRENGRTQREKKEERDDTSTVHIYEI